MGAADCETGVVQGVPVQPQGGMHTVRVVEVADPAGPAEHYMMGCLAGGFCGCLGLVGQRLCCPTLRGNYGGCAGYAANTLIGTAVVLLLLILEQSLGWGTFRTQGLDYGECVSYGGEWRTEPLYRCYLSVCPYGYEEQGTRTSLYGVEECSMAHLLLVVRLIQIAAGLCFGSIAVAFCLRYRREVKEAAQEDAQPFVRHAPAAHAQVGHLQQPAGAVPTAC